MLKKSVRAMFLIAIGFIIGTITMSYLCILASSSFLEIVKQNYQIEQKILAIHAKKEGNWKEAIRHYANLVSASSPPGLYCFNKNYWSIDFPFASVILNKVINADKNHKDNTLSNCFLTIDLLKINLGSGFI